VFTLMIRNTLRRLQESQICSLLELKFFFGEISSQDILLFQVGKERSLKPVGRTLFQGRLVPTVIEVPTPTEFVVYRLNKYTPPYFVERPFEHISIVSCTHL
jgi:hypothetical protein